MTECNAIEKVDLIVTDLGGTLVKADEAVMAALRRTPSGRRPAQSRY